MSNIFLSPVDGSHGGLPGEGGEVRAHVSRGEVGEAVEVGPSLEPQVAAQHAEDLPPRRRVRDPERDLAVETARPSQRRVNSVRPDYCQLTVKI